MSDRTQISWADATWSPVTGCTKVSEGCEHCYIERTPPFRMERRRFSSPGIGGTTGVRLHPDRLDQPLHWRKPRKVFVCSMADLFHDDVPDGYIAQVFAAMAHSKHHVFQVLTKRPARMRSLLGASFFPELVTTWAWRMGIRPTTQLVEFPLPNVWLGVSVESQKWANSRIPLLLDTPAAVRWLSCEPLLGPLNLGAYVRCRVCRTSHKFSRQPCDPHTPARFRALRMTTGGDIDWVVVGGESGPGARPMHPDWARSLRDQCVAAGVPFHFKQWGEWGPAPWSIRVCDPKVGWTGTDEELTAAKADAEARGATHAYASWAHEYGHELYEPPHKPWSLERADDLDGPHAPMRRWGKKRAGRELDGRTWDEYPAVVAEVSGGAL